MEKPVVTYERLLRQLHKLIRAGKSDSPDAETLRDELDAPWYLMTTDEHTAVNRLSEALSAGVDDSNYG